jgi:NRAMP (natural resistance-associated macrophage protein)-like metal ion transporter
MQKKEKKRNGFLDRVGPGFITGAADDDPSGIGTYAQTGAMFGYSHLWLSFFSFPFMTAIQEMCGRIGLVTGNGLAGVVRTHYSRRILFGLVGILLVTNTINIGADLGAMAATGELLFGIPFPIWLIGITVVTLGLEIFVSYATYAKYLKYLALTLLAYVAASFAVKQDWAAVAFATFVPHLSLTKETFLNIVAVLGTTISPYIFFWQADEEAEEEILQRKIKAIGVGTPRVSRRDIRSLRTDTVLGMLFSNLIMFFIILTAAATLHAHGISNIETAADAAEALRPLAGNFTFALFAIGIMGTGLLAIPILSGSAAYAVAEVMQWKSGLSLKLRQARAFYGVIVLSTLIGLLVNFLGVPPFKMLYYTAVLNGIAAPPLIFIILRISNDRKVMGRHVNSRWSNVLGWSAGILMTLACIALLVTSVV